jgi:Fe-S-cluster containining protein
VPSAKPKKKREDLKPGECLCDHCTGKCCRYFSLPIDTPSNWDDFDSIRWYLAHAQTKVYVEKKTWYLLVTTRCQYLTKDNRCGIYLNRPKICREYSSDECEYDSDYVFEQVFETPEQIWEYAEAVLPPRRRKATAAERLPVVTIGPAPSGNGNGKRKGRV